MRMYLTSANHPDNPTVAGQAGGWTNTLGNVKSLMSPTKQGSNTAGTAIDNVTTNPNNLMIRRWLALPFQRGGLFDPGELLVVFARQSTNTDAGFRTRFALVVHASTGTIRASFGSVTFSTGSIWPTTLTGSSASTAAEVATAVSAGEYLSFELGITAINSTSSSRTATLRYGGTDATELVSGSTSGVTTRSPYIDMATPGLEDFWVPPTGPPPGRMLLAYP